MKFVIGIDLFPFGMWRGTHKHLLIGDVIRGVVWSHSAECCQSPCISSNSNAPHVHNLIVLFDIFKLLWISIKPILACNKNLQSVGEHDEFGGVIEHNADALIAQLVAEAILVAVVHPLAHPHQRLRRWVAQLVGQALRTTLQLKEQIQL